MTAKKKTKSRSQSTQQSREPGELEEIRMPQQSERDQKSKGSPEQKHAVVVDGSIDSVVLLHQTRKAIPDAKIVAIMAGDAEKKDLNPIMKDLNITPTESAKFKIPEGKKKTTEANEDDWHEFFDAMNRSETFVVHFPVNQDEQSLIEEKSIPRYNRLKELASIHSVQVSTPLAWHPEREIIRMAVDEYGIDLEATAEPDTKDKKAMEIRNKAFSEVGFSRTLNRKIVDPFDKSVTEEDLKPQEVAPAVIPPERPPDAVRVTAAESQILEGEGKSLAEEEAEIEEEAEDTRGEP
jgi:hypothetical protein